MRIVGMLLLASSLASWGCSLIAPVCTDELVYGIEVGFFDSDSRQRVFADSATAVAVSPAYSDTTYDSGQIPFIQVVEDRPGTYDLTVRVAGYAEWRQVGVRVVEADDCHVKTTTVSAFLDRMTN